MLDQVKKLVGADRAKPSAIDKARAAVDSAQAELERVRGEQLRIEKAQRAVDDAATELQRLESELTAGRIVELERTIANLPAEIGKLAADAEVQSALSTLLRAVADREALIQRARSASTEIGQLQPNEPEHRSTARSMALSMAPTLRSQFAQQIGLVDLHKLERLFVGGS